MARAAATAASPMTARMAGVMPGAGASSTTFWWRRCSEQSRSNRCTALPWASASTWTSTWRGPRNPPLDEHPVVAEARAGLASRSFERVAEAGFGVGAPHPLAATPRDRLHQHRKADAAGVGEKRRVVCSSPW